MRKWLSTVFSSKVKSWFSLNVLIIGFFFIFIANTYGATQSLTSYTLSITEIEGLQHSFSGKVYKIVNNSIAATYDVSNSIQPIYSSSPGQATQFANNILLISVANNVFPQNDIQQLIENAGSIMQEYGVNNVTLNVVYDANVYNTATNSYVEKWAVNTVLWTPNISNLATLDFGNILSRASGWIVTTPNPYLAEITYFTHNVEAGLQALPNYSSVIAPVLNQYMGNLLVQIYQLTANGIGNLVTTPLNTNVSAQTAYNDGFEVNEVNNTVSYSPQVLVTNLINYVNGSYLAPYSPQDVIVNYINDWSASVDSNGNIQLSISYPWRQINGSCQANYTYGSGCMTFGYPASWGYWFALCFDGNGNVSSSFQGWHGIGNLANSNTLSTIGAAWPNGNGASWMYISDGYLAFAVTDASSPVTNYFNLFSMGSYSQWEQAAGAGRWTVSFSYNQGWLQVNGSNWVQILQESATSCTGTYYNNINIWLNGITALENVWLVPEPFQNVPTDYGNSYSMQQISQNQINPTALNSGNLSSGKQYAVSIGNVNPNNINLNNVIIDPFTNQLCDYTISSGTDSLGYGACSFDTSLISSVVPVTSSLSYSGSGCAPGETYQNGYCVIPAKTISYTNCNRWYSYSSGDGCTSYTYCGSCSQGTYQACPDPFWYSNGYCYAPVGAVTNHSTGGGWYGLSGPWINGWGNYNGSGSGCASSSYDQCSSDGGGW